MRGITGWHYRPYRQANHMTEAQLPFICRLAPGEDAFEMEWFDGGSPDEHVIEWRLKDSDRPWDVVAACSARVKVTGLESDRDYELRVARRGEPGGMSALRYVRTGAVPGRVVNYLHPEDTLYAFSGRALCSPSLVKVPSGALLASMDVYGPGAPQNLTLLFRSDDRGRSWRYVTDLFPCYWASLFMHRGRLYIQGCSTEYGDILIGVSDDEGCTWSAPVRLFAGSGSSLTAGWQRQPMPIVKACGRLFVSVDYGAWKEGGHRVGMLSAPEDADLLDSRNWSCSELTAYDPRWPGAPKGDGTGFLEGSMALGKDGKLLNLLRIGIARCEPSHGMAILMEANPEEPESPLRFHRFIDMPSGSNSKTHLLCDETSGQYIAIGNLCVDPATPAQRNVLALQASPDLYEWRVVKILLDYRQEDPKEVGFQYISFIIDGKDILYLSRTAMNKARNFHDANYSTFHVVEDFRQYL